MKNFIKYLSLLFLISLNSTAQQAYIIGFGSNNVLSVDLNTDGTFNKDKKVETKVIVNPWYLSQSNKFAEDKTFYLNQENAAELSFYKLISDTQPLEYLGGLRFSGHPWGWGFADDYLYISSHMENRMYVYKRNSNTQYESIQTLSALSPVGFGIIDYYLYTTSWTGNKAMAYAIDKNNGKLTLMQETPSCIAPRGIWTFDIGNSDSPYHIGYTVCENSNQVGIYKIDSDHKLISLGNTSSKGINPITMGFHFLEQSGKKRYFAYVANYLSNDIAVFKIHDSLEQNPGTLEYFYTYKTGINPFNFAVNSQNKLLYVPNMGSNDIYTYKISDDGQLNLLDKWKVPEIISPVTVVIY